MRGIVAVFAALAFVLPAQAQAQPYPNKPIRLIVGYPPGGSVDTSARILAERLGPALGQQILIENRAGATGNIAADVVAKSPPDGYTLYMGTSINAVSASLFKNLPYDPLTAFAPISQVVLATSVLAIHPSLPFKSVKELVDYSKANPGKLTYATTGPGSSPHLCAELLSTLAGIQMLHVPYKGGTQAMTDLLGGQVALSFSNPTSVLQHAATGKIRLLAVTGAKRFSGMPDVPTMQESGYPTFDLDAWYGLMAPAGTPKEIVDRLSLEVGNILRRPDVRALLVQQGLEAAPTTPAELGEILKRDVAKYAKLLRDANIQPQ